MVKRVVVVKTHPSHLLHLVLTLLTGGLWIPVWITVTVYFMLKRATLR